MLIISGLTIWTAKSAFFVSRFKPNTRIKVLESCLTDKNHKHILSGRDVKLTGLETAQKYQKNPSIVKVSILTSFKLFWELVGNFRKQEPSNFLNIHYP